MKRAKNSIVLLNRPVGVVVKDSAIGAVCLEFDSCADKIVHNVATAAIFLRSCAAKALSCGDGPATRYPFRRHAASIITI